MSWLTHLSSTDAISQGEIIEDCQVPQFDARMQDGTPSLVQEIKEYDAVVLSQACELAHKKIRHALVCPAIKLSEFHDAWTESQTSSGNNVTERAWKKEFERLKRNDVINLCYVGSPNFVYPVTPGEDAELGWAEPRIIDFREMHTVPILYLEGQKSKIRQCIDAPYIQFVSQRLGNFLTRVGLPD